MIGGKRQNKNSKLHPSAPTGLFKILLYSSSRNWSTLLLFRIPRIVWTIRLEITQIAISELKKTNNSYVKFWSHCSKIGIFCS